MTMLNGEPVDTPNISTAQPAPPATDDPITRILGIVSVVLALVFPVAGIVVAAIGLSRARGAGASPGLNLVGLILSIVMTVVVVAVTVVVIVVSVNLLTNVVEICQQLGPGIHRYNGVTYECN